MLFFYVTEDLCFRVRPESALQDSRPVVDLLSAVAASRCDLAGCSMLSAPSASSASVDSIYVATEFEIRELSRAARDAGCRTGVRVLGPAQADLIHRTSGMPLRAGYLRRSGSPFVSIERQVERLERCRPLRLAIANPFCLGFGDAIVFISAARELRERLRRLFPEVAIESLQVCFSRRTDDLYLRSGVFAGTRSLPLSLRAMADFDAYIDLTVEYMREDVPWIDSCLEALGIEPAEVPNNRKRNALRVDPAVEQSLGREARRVKSLGRPLLLFHPLASTPIRSMPAPVIPRVIEGLLQRVDCTIVSAIPVRFSHDRFIDWSPSSRTFEQFTYLVSVADMFITVDTVTYHVADAFQIPGVVLFTSIAPTLRTTYYPYVEGISLRPDTRLAGMHFSEREQDVRYADSLWEHLDLDHVAYVLRSIVARRAQPTGSTREAIARSHQDASALRGAGEAIDMT